MKGEAMLGRLGGRRWKSEQDGGPEVTGTRHAIERYAKRGRTLPEASVKDELRHAVVIAIEEDRLLEVAGGGHLLPLRGPRGWLCLVIGLAGPRLKPYAAIVYSGRPEPIEEPPRGTLRRDGGKGENDGWNVDMSQDGTGRDQRGSRAGRVLHTP
jgi:hypothetical protein